MGTFKKLAFIIVESELRWRFFKRFINAFYEDGYDVKVVTICPTVYWERHSFCGEIFLLSKCKKDVGLVDLPSKEILDIESGIIAKKDAREMVASWLCELDEIAEDRKPDVCFIYNGTTILPYTSKLWCEKNKISTLFFELANIDGKMFIDPIGTNAKSYLYKNISVLQQYHVSDTEYSTWYKKYIDQDSKVKQANFSKQFKTVFLFALNQIYFIFYINSITGKVKFLKDWVTRFIKRYKRKKIISSKYNLFEMKPYYLFPMQVSVDSQVLLNSEVGLLSAIEKVKDIARKENKNLIIKLHPAEQNKDIVDYLNTLETDRVKVSNMDIKKLINNAEKIITINSTVGLESILYEKNVEFLGRSFYKNFINNKELLKAYICRYLVDINYFDVNDIDKFQLKRCIGRAKNG